MNLREIRHMFVHQNGLADLVDDYPTCEEDTGADYYINEGQKFLDGIIEVPGSRRSWPVDIASGASEVLVKGLRVAEAVSIMNADGIVPLEHKTPDELRALYPTAVADMTGGAPVYWSEMILTAPKLWRKTSSNFTNLYPDIRYGADSEVDGICFRPPTDAAYTLEVVGLWFSRELTNNTDVSWWSINQPMALLQAAALMVEMYFSNSSGINDKMNSINLFLRSIDSGAIYKDITHTSRRRG